MKLVSYSAVSAICVLSGVMFLACSDDVSQEATSGSGGSSSSTSDATTASAGGGSASSATATTSATTTTTSATTTTTSGGGSLCDQSCDKIANECGFGDLCPLLQQYLGDQFDCTNPISDCPAQCILDASCDQIATVIAMTNPDPELTGCVLGCGGTGAGGGGGGGSTQACLQCTATSCLNQATACNSDATCQSWLGCVQNCADPSCVTACSQQYPSAAPLYDPLFACQCASCDAQCGAVADPCNQGSGAGGAGGS